jgi:hypothetical protein
VQGSLNLAQNSIYASTHTGGERPAERLGSALLNGNLVIDPTGTTFNYNQSITPSMPRAA